jgi:hypothetical protein
MLVVPTAFHIGGMDSRGNQKAPTSRFRRRVLLWNIRLIFQQARHINAVALERFQLILPVSNKAMLASPMCCCKVCFSCASIASRLAMSSHGNQISKDGRQVSVVFKIHHIPFVLWIQTTQGRFRRSRTIRWWWRIRFHVMPELPFQFNQTTNQHIIPFYPMNMIS